MSDEIEMRRKRAGYRANHRGTKEMDWFLGRYADAKLAYMGPDELLQFERFIAISDPELHRWIVSPQLCANSEFSGLVMEIRDFHKFNE
jgi:antitoxin CptB